MDKNILVAIDIGSQKVKVLIAEVANDSTLRIVGISTDDSDGMRRGSVVNIDKAVRAIHRAVQDAESMSGVQVKEAWINISGRHLVSINSRATVTVTHGDEINASDVKRAVNHAETLKLPTDRIPLRTFAKDFTVDSQCGISDPIGMSGLKLEADVHVVTAAATAKDNLIRCVEKAGIKPLGLLPDALASALAILDEDDKEIGVAVIDIGSATTDIAIYHGNAIHFTTSIDLGGDHITNDIAIALRLTANQAEDVKRKEGACIIAEVNDRYITLPGKGNGDTRETSRSYLAQIIEARVREILEISMREMQLEGFFTDHRSTPVSRIRLTGGSSLLEGIDRVALEVFNQSNHWVDDVSVSWPQGLSGIAEQVCKPTHSTGVGLLQFGLSEQSQIIHNGKSTRKSSGLVDSLKNAWSYIRNNF